MFKPNREVLRHLASAVLAFSVETLQAWCGNWQRWRDGVAPATFVKRLDAALQADAWLTSEAHTSPDRLTVAEICEALDLDAGQLVHRLYAMLDPEALSVLWNVHAARKAVEANREARGADRPRRSIEGRKQRLKAAVAKNGGPGRPGETRSATCMNRRTPIEGG